MISKRNALCPYIGDDKLSVHAWYDPIERLQSFEDQGQLDLLAPKIGQVVRFEEKTSLVQWWKEVEKTSTESELAVHP